MRLPNDSNVLYYIISLVRILHDILLRLIFSRTNKFSNTQLSTHLQCQRSFLSNTLPFLTYTLHFSKSHFHKHKNPATNSICSRILLRYIPKEKEQKGQKITRKIEMTFLVASSLINLAICQFLHQHRFPSVPSNIPHPCQTVRPIADASVQSHPR